MSFRRCPVCQQPLKKLYCASCDLQYDQTLQLTQGSLWAAKSKVTPMPRLKVAAPTTPIVPAIPQDTETVEESSVFFKHLKGESMP